MKVLPLFLVLTVASGGCDRISASTYVTEPSSAGYQVRLRGELHDTPDVEFVSYVVRAELMGRAWDQAFEIFRTDKRDLAFRQEYPTESWIDPTVLRFGPGVGRGRPQREVKVLNRSNATLSHLLMNCGDMFLLFDVADDKTFSLDCRVSDWISASGSFEGGRLLPERVLRIPAATDTVIVRVTHAGVELGDRD